MPSVAKAPPLVNDSGGQDIANALGGQGTANDLGGQGTRIVAEQHKSFGALRSPVINAPLLVAKMSSMPPVAKILSMPPVAKGSSIHGYHAMDGVYAPPSGSVALLRCPVVNVPGDQGSGVVALLRAAKEPLASSVMAILSWGLTCQCPR